MKTRESKSRAIRFADLPKIYVELVAFHLPRPIHDRIELRAATAILDAMAGHDLNKDQEDYLDLLSDLVDHYETARDPVADSKITPLKALEYLMEQHAMTQSDLGRLLGERPLGHLVLSGKRELSKAHIRVLADHFRVSPALFF